MAGSGTAHLRAEDDSLLRVEHLVVEYPAGRHQKVHAVSDVSFDVRKGETLGLVGESGCGKSTVGRAVIQFPHPTAGKVVYDGKDLTQLKGQELRRTRSKLQMIFQDPISSLNPRRKIGDIVAEGLNIWKPEDGREVKDIVLETMQAVGLDPDTVMGRRPHEFSGGQCQRISIARSLAIQPELIICDEPVASLDVSIQAQILNLLEDMKERYGLTLIFIAHDLAVVKIISDRIIVMYLGKICEVGPADTLYSQPLHPYTRALLDAVPVPDPEVAVQPPAARGELPSPLNPPSGCRFRTRCPRAEQRCADEEPQMRELAPEHFAACHFPLTGEHRVTMATASGYVGTGVIDTGDSTDWSDPVTDTPGVDAETNYGIAVEPSPVLVGEDLTEVEGSVGDDGVAREGDLVEADAPVLVGDVVLPSAADAEALAVSTTELGTATSSTEAGMAAPTAAAPAGPAAKRAGGTAGKRSGATAASKRAGGTGQAKKAAPIKKAPAKKKTSEPEV